jgi:hypothetical protein
VSVIQTKSIPSMYTKGISSFFTSVHTRIADNNGSACQRVRTVLVRYR